MSIDVTDRVLDWKPAFDEKSKNFPMRAALPTAASPLLKRRNKLWKVGPTLDQGGEGACVGFGWTSEALSTPIAVDLSKMEKKVPTDPTQFALGIYREAKKIDEWAGEDYDGTSVLAGAKIMKSYGLLKEYRWAFTIDEVVDTILVKGPVVLGIYWHYDMYEPVNGVVTPTGDIVGGHCLTAVGYSLKSKKLGGEDGIILQNSWGNSWGNKGLAEIKVSDLSALLKNDGEACASYGRSYGRPKLTR